MPFDLATINKQTRALFDAQQGLELVVLFGSVATGQTHAKSDFDIAILPRTGVSMTLMQELQLQHALSVATGLEVDLVRLDRATPVVKREVARNGIPLLERSPGAFSQFAANAALEYLELQPLLEQGRKRYLARVSAGQK